MKKHILYISYLYRTNDLVPTHLTTQQKGYEDYYAAFTRESSPVFRIQDGAVGRMDRRGGEPVYLEIVCEPRGHQGVFEGTLVVNLPDDDSKLTYTVEATTM